MKGRCWDMCSRFWWFWNRG